MASPVPQYPRVKRPAREGRPQVTANSTHTVSLGKGRGDLIIDWRQQTQVKLNPYIEVIYLP